MLLSLIKDIKNISSTGIELENTV